MPGRTRTFGGGAQPLPPDPAADEAYSAAMDASFREAPAPSPTDYCLADGRTNCACVLGAELHSPVWRTSCHHCGGIRAVVDAQHALVCLDCREPQHR